MIKPVNFCALVSKLKESNKKKIKIKLDCLIIFT